MSSPFNNTFPLHPSLLHQPVHFKPKSDDDGNNIYDDGTPRSNTLIPYFVETQDGEFINIDKINSFSSNRCQIRTITHRYDSADRSYYVSDCEEFKKMLRNNNQFVKNMLNNEE